MIVENVIEIKSGIMINVGWVQNPKEHNATCSCKNGKYLGSIIDDSVITCDEIIDTTETVPTKGNCFNKF